MEGPLKTLEMIPSEPREPGWKRFLSMMPHMLSKPLPTQRELPIAHRLVTSGIEMPAIPEWLIHENLLEGIALVRGISLEAVWKGIEASGLAPEVAVSIVRKKMENGGVELDPHVPRRGVLRSLGKIIITEPDRFEYPMYHGHTKPLFDETGKEFSFGGLGPGLNIAFEELCDSFDVLIKKAKGFEKLRILTLFQMYGATVVHPFWDANGRAFGAHMVLTLNRLGYQVSEVPALPEVNEKLSKNIFGGIYADFLWNFLESRNIPLMTADEMGLMRMREPDTYAEYTLRLHAAISHAIQMWPAVPEPDAPYTEGGFTLLRYWLSKHGHLPKDFYERIGPIIEQGIQNGGYIEANQSDFD